MLLGVYYMHISLTGKDCRILPISLAIKIARYCMGNIQILSRQYLAILASHDQLGNMHRVAPLNSHKKKWYIIQCNNQWS